MESLGHGHDRSTWDTSTRSQLLKERGYPPEVVNGNGQVVASTEAGPAPLPSVTVVESAVNPPRRVSTLPGDDARLCTECQAPIPASFPARRVTCSTACSDQRNLRQRWSLKESPRPRAPSRARARRSPAATVTAARPAATPTALTNLLFLLENLSSQLGPGWQVEMAPAQVNVSWRPSTIS